MFRFWWEMITDNGLCSGFNSIKVCCFCSWPPDGDTDLYWCYHRSYCTQCTIHSLMDKTYSLGLWPLVTFFYLRWGLTYLCLMWTVSQPLSDGSFLVNLPVVLVGFVGLAVAGEGASLIWNTLSVGLSHPQTYLHPSLSLALWNAPSPSLMDMCVCVGGPTVFSFWRSEHTNAPSTPSPFIFYAKSKFSDGQDIIAAVWMDTLISFSVE